MFTKEDEFELDDQDWEASHSSNNWAEPSNARRNADQGDPWESSNRKSFWQTFVIAAGSDNKITASVPIIGLAIGFFVVFVFQKMKSVGNVDLFMFFDLFYKQALKPCANFRSR